MSCPGFELRFGSFNACIARATQTCLYEHAPREGAVKLAALERCANSQSTAQCADVLSDRLDGCERVPGTLSDGEACIFDAQCASQFCLRRADETCGKCAPAPKIGEACKLDRCGAGSACVDGTCVKRQAGGGECKTTSECDDRLACVAGKCSPFADKAGDACDPKGEGRPPCDAEAGLFCDPTSKRCAPVELAKEGEPCGDGLRRRCRGDATCVDGKCAPLVRIGEPCKEGAGCVGIAKCIEGRCKVPELRDCSN